MAPLVNRLGVELATGGPWEKWPLPRVSGEFLVDQTVALQLALEHRLYDDLELPHFSSSEWDREAITHSSFVARLGLKLALSDDREYPSSMLLGLEWAGEGNALSLPFGATIGWSMPRTTMQLHLGLLTTVALGGETTSAWDSSNGENVDLYVDLSDLPRLQLQPQAGLQVAFALLEEWGLYLTAESFVQVNAFELFFDDAPWDEEYLNLDGDRSTFQITLGFGPGFALVTPWFDLTTSFDFFPLRLVNEAWLARKPGFFRFHFGAAGYF